MDPLGQETGAFDPFLIISDPNYSDVHGDVPMFEDGGDPFHLSDGCGDIDGMPASCSEISERMNNGTAVEDPGYVWGRERNDATERLENYVHARSAVFVPFTSSIGGQVPTYGLACTNASGGPYKCESYVSGYTTVAGTNPQDTVTTKESNLPYTYVADLIEANNQSKIPNSVILCQAYKESSAKGYSVGSGRNRRWHAPPVGTFYNATQGSVSHRGLMQVSPVAAQKGGLGNGLGLGLSDAKLQSVNPDYINNIWDPAANISAGTGYLKYLMDHGKDIKGALKAYGPPNESTYASDILDCAARVDAGDTLGGLGLLNR
jgi:hypothetical protein